MGDEYWERYGLPPLLTIKQAAAVLNNMPSSTIRSMCERGDIFAVKCGRQWRVHRDRLLEQYGLIKPEQEDKDEKAGKQAQKAQILALA